MKKRFTIFISALLCLSFGMSLFAACKAEEEYPTWKLSSTVTASFSDNGNYGYVLTIEGSGKMNDFSSKKDAPWYGKSGRVTQIEITDGITYIANNAFTDCAAKTVILPDSVTSAGENAFSANAKVYAYSKISNTENVYCYSETQPTESGNYWHIVNDTVAVWPTAEAEPLKVLFIGNSYTYYNSLPVLFKKVANAAGAKVEVASVTAGSRRFSEWSNPTNVYGTRVEAALTATNDYDIVVLQERSVSPLSEYDAFSAGAKALATRISQTQKNCKIYLYQTWGNPSSQGNYGGSIPEMESRLRTAYKTVATEIGATVSYVGKAFTYVYETYNLATLGTQSPYWLYQSDNTHPTYLGSYLAACVHTATILGIDPRTTVYNGEFDAEMKAWSEANWEGYSAKNSVGLDEATATLMKEIAYNMVFGS